MPIEKVAPQDNLEVTEKLVKVARLIKGYEQAKLSPEGVVVYTIEPHFEIDRYGKKTKDPYGREDLVPKGEAFLLIQAGDSEDTENPADFHRNESHRAIIAHITPGPAETVTVEYAYITLDQRVDSLSPQNVIAAFKDNPEVVYGSDNADPQKLGSRPILSENPPALGMLKEATVVGGQPITIDRRGTLAPTVEVIIEGERKQYPTDIQLGLPNTVETNLLGYGSDDKVVEYRQK